MELNQTKKSVWISGEVCETLGIYFSDTCNHKLQKEFTANDIFTRCPLCHQAVRWMRFGSSAIRAAKNV